MTHANHRALIRNGAVVLTGSFILYLLAAYFATRMHHFAAIGDDDVVLYVGACPYSIRTLYNLERRKASSQSIVAVPVDEAAEHLVCPDTLRKLSARTWILSTIPYNMACKSLRADARAFYLKNLTRLPGYSMGRTRIPPGSERFVFEAFGLDYRLDNHGGGVFRELPSPRIRASLTILQETVREGSIVVVGL